MMLTLRNAPLSFYFCCCYQRKVWGYAKITHCHGEPEGS